MPRRSIDLALDLARMPALAAAMREQALPPDLLDLIRIAAGCPDASKVALTATQKPLRVIRAAAILYLEEMLFFPDAGLRRNLGVSAQASKAEMRVHMRWLLQWLHPDHNSDETAVLLAGRVIHAWHELGSSNRLVSSAETSAAEPSVHRQPSPNVSRRGPGMRVPWIAVPIAVARPPPARKRAHRAVILVFAAGVALALILIPEAIMFGWLSHPRAKGSSASTATQARDGPTLVDVTNK